MNTLPSCRSDACAQGKKNCPCPQACLVPQDDEEDSLPWVFIIALIAIGLLCAVSPSIWS